MQQNDINLDELAKHIIAAMFIFCSDVIIIKEIWCFGIVQKCFSKFCAMSNLLEMNFSGLMILITFGITAKIIFSTVPDLILWMFVLKKKKKSNKMWITKTNLYTSKIAREKKLLTNFRDRYCEYF